MTAMYKIIFATGNEGKMKEIREILDGLTFLGEKVQILSMKEAGIDIDIIEDGTTFEENAMIKARAVAGAAKEAIVLADDSGLVIDGRELSTRGTIEGWIGYEEKGLNGFGFDPIFYVPEIGKYTAELSDEDKNRISHRGKALRAMREELEKELEKKLG